MVRSRLSLLGLFCALSLTMPVSAHTLDRIMIGLFNTSLAYTQIFQKAKNSAISLRQPERFYNPQACFPFPPEKQHLVNTVLEAFNVPQNTFVILHAQLGNLGPAYIIGDKVIIIDTQALEAYDDETLIFLLGHELSHGLNKDVATRVAIGGTMPILTAAFTYTVAYGVQKIFDKLERTSPQYAPAMNIASSLTHYLLTFHAAQRKACLHGINYLIRAQEKRADIQAARALKNTTGGIKFVQHECKKNLANKAQNPLLHVDKYGNNLNDHEHPKLTDRIAYLEKIDLT